MLRRIWRGRHLHLRRWVHVIDVPVVRVDVATVGTPFLICHVLRCSLSRVVIVLLLSHLWRDDLFLLVVVWVVCRVVMIAVSSELSV
jgi:hypothetical protein